MRTLLALVIALALALPAAAAADGSAGSPVGGSTTKVGNEKNNGKPKKLKKAKKQKQKKQKKRKAQKTGVTKTRAGLAGDEIEVKGALTSLTPPTVGTVSCAVPPGKTVTGFAVGDVVEMKCAFVDGAWLLRKLEREGDDRDELEVEGTIQALTPLLTVSGVSCAVPAGVSLAGLDVGDRVEMKCRSVGGTWTLVRVKAEDDDDSGPGGTDDDDDNSGRGGDDDDDDDDDDDGDRSGSGGGDDDDDDDNSGRGGDDD